MEELKLILEVIGNASDAAFRFAIGWLIIQAIKSFMTIGVASVIMLTIYKIAQFVVRVNHNNDFLFSIWRDVQKVNNRPYSCHNDSISNFQKTEISNAITEYCNLKKGVKN